MSHRFRVVIAAGFLIAVVIVVAALVVPATLRGPARRGLGEERGFGGFDPHLGVAVEAWESIGPGSSGTGRFRATVRVRNGAADIDVDPSTLAIVVVDAAGGEYPAVALRANDERGPVHARLPSRVGPGETHVQAFVFDLPAGVADPELVIWTDDWIGRLLPRSEANPLVEMMRVPLAVVDEQPRSRSAQEPQRP